MDEIQSLKNAVVTVNANALHCLQQGQYRQATTGFLSALQSAKLLLHQFRDDNNDTTVTNNNGGDREMVTEEREPPFSSVEVNANPQQQAALLTSQGTIPLFSKCLLLKDQHDLEAMVAQNQDTIPCLLLYNVGLSLHLEAMHTGNETLTSKALNAYEIALMILTNLQQQQDDEHLEGDHLYLLLAILNNIACIEAQRFNITKTMQYVILIQDILENDEFSDLLSDSFFDFFVLYLFLTPSMYLSAAPSA